MRRIVSMLTIRVTGVVLAGSVLAGCKSSSAPPSRPGCFLDYFTGVVWTSDPGALTPGPAPDAASFTPASHTPFPLVTSNGGATLGTLRLVTVVVAGDPLRDKLMAFG